ncbi:MULTISPECIES: Rha family transcriptional regulator [Pseudomonas]|uniref:Rha family transcriptional regulator n=1 Tax=Pseudomonas TaxID=286 RepID=UPI0014734184|nr:MULTISPECIES: Rha family transcriptional regulator [Pseudomonas]MCU0209144.1 Rha family transcriptional regulator [Pseudomonas shahriarae]NMY19005.1 transcriptional regulator [Pseudomonas sp. WS 5410]
MTDLKTITMTTVEIAAMTGKRHDHVLRDARRVLDHVLQSRLATLESKSTCGKMAPDLGASIGATGAVYLDAYEREKPMLILNKHMVFTIITGYDTALRYTVVGRWIELEQAANPAFGSQAITDTLIDLQSRVDMMAPAYAEHTRKGASEGYTWREACRLAGVENPDKVLAMFKDKGLARTSKGLTEIHPKYIDRGHAKPVNPRNKAVKLTGHLFRITHKGLTEWLQPKAESIAKALKEHLKVRPVVDGDGFVVDIVGEGASGMTVQDVTAQL